MSDEHAQPFAPSLARRGFDFLLAMHPHLDVVEVDWQRGERSGPWLLVTLGQQSDTGDDVFALHPYAIWKATGAIYGVRDGAVGDDPLWQPAEVTA